MSPDPMPTNCDPPPGGWGPNECPPPGCPSEYCRWTCEINAQGQCYCHDWGVVAPITSGAIYKTLADCEAARASIQGCCTTPAPNPDKCCGNFEYGTKGVATNPNQQCFVNCCGNVCPPQDCCDSITITYQCGSTAGQYPAEGCSCVYSGINFHGILYKKKNLPPMPSFDLENKTHSESVFILYDCSIPCSNITVTLTTSGCCLYLSGQSVYAVGSGDVSASLSSRCAGNCGNLNLILNGTKRNSVSVSDGDLISVSLIPQNSNCCQCCEVHRSCGSTSVWLLKQKNNKKFLVLNKEKFIKRLNILRTIKIKNKNKKLR